MVYDITYSPAALKDLAAIADARLRARILAHIGRLENFPFVPNIKKLETPVPLWRQRIGEWRVIFSVDQKGKEIHVLRIEPRKEVYR